MMLDELRELYQEIILDHGRNPRNFRQPVDATCLAHGHNPMCGDELTVFLTVDSDGRITDAAFDGKGCAISVASASLMTKMIQGKTTEEAETLVQVFQNICTKDDFDATNGAGVDVEALEQMQVLGGVRNYPVRVKCATLAWHTMKAAMSGDTEVSTESENL